jgi:hypothetical protein
MYRYVPIRIGLGLFAWGVLAQDPAWYAKRATLRETFAASFAALESGKDGEEAQAILGPWYVLGAFDNTDTHGFDTAYPPEKGVDLTAEYEGAEGRKIRWRRMDGFKDGQANNLMIFEKNAAVCAYAYREIESPREHVCQWHSVATTRWRCGSTARNCWPGRSTGRAGSATTMRRFG